jgi:hypothetical protein
MNTILQQHLDELKKLFPNYEFTLTYKLIRSEKETTKLIKDFVKELKKKYSMFNFTFKSETYNSNLSLFISSKKDQENISYYGGDSCGYITYNNNYFEVLKEIKSFVKSEDIRLDNYVENNRTCSLYFYYN